METVYRYKVECAKAKFEGQLKALVTIRDVYGEEVEGRISAVEEVIEELEKILK